MRKPSAADPAAARQRLRDWGRHGLLLLLLVTAFLLLRHTGYWEGVQRRLPLRRPAAAQSADAAAPAPRPYDALAPLAVTVHGAEGGGRYGAAYNAETTAAVFRRFSVDLAEALGSAGAPGAVPEEDFRALLDRSALAMQFAAPVPLALLSGWLGVDMGSAAASDAAAWLCLSAPADGGVTLSYRTEDGACYACDTAANADGFRGRAAEFTPNGALYAWESERIENGGGFLLLPDAPLAYAVRSAVPLPRGDEADAMLSAVGMNTFVTSSYTESDGTVVYVSDDNTLRISAAGEVFFRRAGTPDAAAQTGLAAAVGRAWQVAERCLGTLPGDGALQFAGAAYVPAQRSYTVYLDYAVNGIPVRLAEGHAAELVLRGENVIQARLQLRQFTLTGEQTALLPCLQAAAIAARAQGRPELIYADAGEATACMWVIAHG